MTWYAASAIVVTKLGSGEQDEYPVYENVYLIEASSPDEALQKADAIGRANDIDDPSLTLNGLPARDCFVGIRKLITVVNPCSGEPDKERPYHGTEVTYARYTLRSEDDIKKLTQGEPVSLTYEE
jgi:Domain of unknown function (DUF4288)